MNDKPSNLNDRIGLTFEETTNDDVYFQFGETEGEKYILDFKTPFSILQAFAIAVTCLKRKYLCE